MSSITLSDAKRWFEVTTLPLNPGLVAIIGKARAAVRRIGRRSVMHRTIGTMNGCGICLHDQLGEKCSVPRVVAAIGFFLLTFGSASIGMGAAIALGGASSGTSGPALNAAEIAARNNDGYLEEYALARRPRR
jgi:hypothetical protein